MRRTSLILVSLAGVLSIAATAPARAHEHDWDGGWHHGWHDHDWHHHRGYAWGHYKPRYYPGYYGYYGYYAPPPPPPVYYPPSITFGFDFH